MPHRRTSVQQWADAARGARSFAAEGAWGRLEGVVVAPRPGTRGFFGRARAAADPVVALVLPQAPGIEQADECTPVDDALALALLAGGAHVARVTLLELNEAPDRDPLAWIDACADALQAASGMVPRARPAVGASWLAGGAAAVLASRRDDLAFLVLAGAPVPEIMSRRTSENEDDPMWAESPSLRLVDGLSALAPLESITVETRPLLVVQGAADATFGAAHLEGWRAALLATGRQADASEVAFADGFFRSVGVDGGVEAGDEAAISLLRQAVADWVGRLLSSSPTRHAR
jgi:dienelactone hydrolase